MAGKTNSKWMLTAYIVVVMLAFPLVAISMPKVDVMISPWAGVVLTILGGLAGLQPVRIPGMRHEIQATHPFILLALASLEPRLAILVAVAGVLGAALIRPGRPAWLKLGFNIAAVGLATAGAWAAFFGTGGYPGGTISSLLVPLFVATGAYMFLNTGFVAVAIALDRKQSVLRTWYAAFSYTLVSYFAGLTVAIAMLSIGHRLVPWSLVLALACFPMFLAYYRGHASAVSSRTST